MSTSTPVFALPVILYPILRMGISIYLAYNRTVKLISPHRPLYLPQ